MDISVTFRHTDPSPAIRQHVEEKIRKLKKYFIKATHAHVILVVEKSRHIAEITLSENHHTFQAKDESHDMYSSLDGALAKMERQLKKMKEKVKSHHKWEPPPETV